MDNVQKTPNAETLRQMPYSELKKIAKEHGIKGNLKAEKIIAALTSSTDSDDTDCFSTPVAKVMNSSRKRKTEKFDEDSKTPLATPRRGTYSIDTPIALKVSEATPPVAADESSILELSNVTASFVKEASVLDMSNITVGRGSERKLRNRKVSFLSPVMTPHTPKNNHLKMRPKTPIGSRTPLAAEDSPFPMKEVKIYLGERVDTTLPMNSLAEKVSNEPDITSASLVDNSVELNEKKTVDSLKSLSLLVKNEASAKREQPATSKSISLLVNNEASTKKKLQATPKSISLPVNKEASLKKKQPATPKSISRLVSNDDSTKKKQQATPRLTRSFLNKNEQLSKKKRLATPNFKKIHEKAFEKMESIDDYQKRVVNSAKKMGVPDFKANKVTKAKSKIPAFGGIPFIPSVAVSKIPSVTVSTIKPDAPALTRKQKLQEKRKLRRDAENANARSKSKFDLKASLSRKLGYKPYSGPLKPLTPSSLLNSSSVMCIHKNKETPAKEPVNKVITSNRMQSRSVLKGVRTNRRFELHMKNRNLE